MRNVSSDATPHRPAVDRVTRTTLKAPFVSLRFVLRLALALVVGAAALVAVDSAAGSSSTRGMASNDGGFARPPPLAPGADRIEVQRQSAAQLKDEKLDGYLRMLADTAAQGVAGGLPIDTAIAALAPPELRHMIGANTLRVTSEGDVQVYIVVDDAADAGLADIAALGASIERVDDEAGIVQAEVPATRLEDVAALSDVRAVRLPDYGVASAGSVMTQGDLVMRSHTARSTYGIDGAGVRIGVIADGLGGLATAQASGDVPEVDTATCNVTGEPVEAPGAEGTAVLEVLHDVAPGASLWFGHFSTASGLGTSLDFQDAVTCLAQHVDIVVDDIGFYGAGPYDGTSDVSLNTAAELNGDGPIRAYFTAVGNMARQHYQDDYIDSGFDLSDGTDFWSAHIFEETPGVTGTEHAGLNPNPSSRNRLLLAPGGSATIILEWDDSWGTSSNDYDTFYQTGDTAFFCGFNRQDGIGDNDYPVEICSITNPTTTTAEFDLFVGNYRDTAAQRNLDLFVLCDRCLSLVDGNKLDFTTAASSVPNQSDAGGDPAPVIAVGAVRYQVPNAVEGFSSRGPTNDGRIKPDVVAPDAISVTGAGGFGSPFFGTSAAAPHAAAVAALILECQPELTREQLRSFVVESAVDIGASGPDNASGWGRVDAVAATDAANCAHAPPTPTPLPGTPSPTPTSTPPPPQCISGDANASGAVNSVDAAVALQRVAGLLGAIPCPPGADVNGDGSVTAIDAALILQYVAGLLASLPV